MINRDFTLGTEQNVKFYEKDRPKSKKGKEMFNIEEELKKLPNKPGVYIMHDKNNKIIYVGKAVNLKRRVTSYFRKTKKTQRILNMVALIDHFEYIVCDNEAEALVLECNLIKKNMPKFNVLLKDDKTYPYIKINVKADFPDVYMTRRVLNDGARYFGPYPNSGAAKEMCEFIKSKFKIRQCKSFKYKDRPCLNYHIKRCSAPCQGYISKEDYHKQINQIISILDGKTDGVRKELEQSMKEASEKMDYEKAAELRDQINAIDRISQRQKVSNISENDIDVIGLYKDEYEICIEIFYIRNSKMVGRDNFFLKGLNDEDDKEIISDFIKQYYMGRSFFPNKIMIKEDIEDRELLEIWLTQMAERKVEIKVPQKGEKLRLVEMAENNAEITLKNKQKSNQHIIVEMKDALKLDKLPRKIECFDISNISGTYMVAGMCVMIDGIIKKNLSRRFKIKTVFEQDDPRCMQEVVERRLRHSIDKEDDGFGKLPDLIFADGGITQIRAILTAIHNVEKESGKQLGIRVFGMVKNDKHRTRALIDENRNEIQVSDEIFNLITQFQDTVHDTAIGYHKFLRDKSMSKSALDDIKGVGTTKKALLLKKFGSVQKIKEATVEEISKVKGINDELAQKIKDELNEN